MARKPDRPALLVRVLAELGAGRITEGFIHDPDTFVHGETTGRGHITINPAIATVDTVVHEILHRLEPGWHENYVRRTTSYLLKRMSDEQIQTVFDEYCKRVKKRKRAPRVES